MHPWRTRISFALSLLICVTALALWGLSYFYVIFYNLGFDRTHSLLVASERGWVGFDYSTTSTPMPWNVSGWNSSPLYDGWRYVTLKSLLHFSKNHVAYATPARVKVQYWNVEFPIWVLMLLSAIAPFALTLRLGRPRSVWKFRDGLRWIDPRLGERLLRFTIFAAVGAAAGAGVGFLQSNWSYNHMRLSLATLWVMAPLACLMAVFTRRRVLWHRALLWIALDLAGCVCFYQAMIERIWSWYRVNLYDIGDLLPLVLLTGALSLAFAGVLLLFLQVKPEAAKPGPYCPECGYCLIGSTRRMCTECGRPFTLDELGISAESLIPAAGRVE